MILSFKPQFVEPILEGTKIHTIREDPHDRWHQGRKIHAATGVRTKHYNCFKEDVCTGVQSIVIEYGAGSSCGYSPAVFVDRRLLDKMEAEQLAFYDGFKRWADFEEWFDEYFEGKIIHWTDFRY